MVDIVSGLRNVSRARQGLSAVRGQVQNRDRVMMLLGPFMFSVGTAAPDSVRHNARYGWPSQARVGVRPLLQWTGPEEESVSLDGTLYPHYRGGLGQVVALRELAGLGRPWLLVDGLGVVYGEFAITHVEETRRVYDRVGAPKRIDFHLQLEHAGEEA
ncbi:MAG: phage tail protein [Billgrantia sp.]